MGNKWLSLSLDKIDGASVDKVTSLFSSLAGVIKDYAPDTADRDELSQIIGDYGTQNNSWNTFGDFVARIDLAEIAKRNPGGLKKLIAFALAKVGTVYPVALAASGVVLKLPDDLISKFLQVGAIVDPAHLIRTATQAAAQSKQSKFVPENDNQLPETARAEDERRTLIVIYKDNLLSGLLRKLIDANDDGEDGIVGTRDGSVNLCAWNEQFYTAMKEQIPEGVKCLYIGDIKGIDGQRSGAGVKFNGYGVSYGFDGTNVYLFADAKALANKSVYDAFLKELQFLPVPASVKASAKKNSALMTVGKIFLATPLLVKDHFDEQNMIKKQQLCYGLYKLYCNDLEAFLDSEEQ